MVIPLRKLGRCVGRGDIRDDQDWRYRVSVANRDGATRDIETQPEQEPSLAIVCAPDFEETYAEVAIPNGGARSSKDYRLIRNAFTLPAMGLTGEKALHVNLRRPILFLLRGAGSD